MMMKAYSLLAFACLVSANACAMGAELTAEQRHIADAVVGEHIRTTQDRITREAKLSENIDMLAERKKEWQGWVPAMRVGFCAKNSQEQHVPHPQTINAQVVQDIIWQYQNAYGDGNNLREHREECARALGFIGNSDGVSTILTSLERESGHFSWQALEGIADERFLPAITAHLDFACQQDAFPAIKCLTQIGTNAIPSLRQFLQGSDRALQRRAIDALITMEASDCVPLLDGLTNSADRQIAQKAQCGINRIRCRAIDKIYSQPTWAPEDDARLWHLTSTALFEEEKTARAKASAAISKIGVPVIGYLRTQLPNYSHADTIKGADFFVSKRAADLMASLGPQAIPALIDALSDEYEHGRRFAAEALQKITGEAHGSDFERWRTWYLKQKDTEKQKSTEAGQGE